MSTYERKRIVGTLPIPPEEWEAGYQDDDGEIYVRDVAAFVVVREKEFGLSDHAPVRGTHRHRDWVRTLVWGDNGNGWGSFDFAEDSDSFEGVRRKKKSRTERKS